MIAKAALMFVFLPNYARIMNFLRSITLAFIFSIEKHKKIKQHYNKITQKTRVVKNEFKLMENQRWKK